MKQKFKSQSVGNYLSMSQSTTFDRKDKIKHYIRWKTYKPIALRFWVKSGVIIESKSLNDQLI